MVLRQRKNKIQELVKDLDVFVKLDQHYVEQTLSGALVFALTFGVCAWLVWTDLTYYFNPSYKFKFAADQDFTGSLEMNVDLTVATPCDGIGADVVDSTNQNTFSYGRLREEPAWFQLDTFQRKHFDSIQIFNEYIREEYHVLQDLLWNSGHKTILGSLPERKIKPDAPYDGCRVHGTLTLNKVEGNFHITAGKSIPIFRGHAHLTGFMDANEYNFSHRIDQFSFGSPHAGIIQPLQGDEKIADSDSVTYQYFVQIVPTEIHTLIGKWQTYQYSVKELARSDTESMPGIQFKYDFAALKVIVTQDREPLWQFLVKLCSGLGGILATAQIVSAILNFAVCKVAPAASHAPSAMTSSAKDTPTTPAAVSVTPAAATASAPSNKQQL